MPGSWARNFGPCRMSISRSNRVEKSSASSSTQRRGQKHLLKILSRVTAPTSGEVRVKGRIASLLEVGTGFHPELTGRENIFLNGAILGMSKAEIKKQFDAIVDFSGVEDFIDTPVKRYSSGMYVRLAFAVAAHLEPEILIVDEVLAVGDAEFQKKCLGKMQDVSTKEGRTVLFVSHHVAAISKLTSRCLVMANGSVALDGPTRNAVEAYFQAAAHEKPLSYQLQKANRLPGGNQAATFVSAHFSRPRPLFESGEDLEFGINFRAHKNVSDLRFSMTVCSLDGTPVGTTCGQGRFSKCRVAPPANFKSACHNRASRPAIISASWPSAPAFIQ